MSTELFSAVAGDVEDLSLPVIVLCHGSMDRSAGMLRLSRQLDDDALVVRYDRRGYAKSSGVGPPFTMADQIDDLVTVLERHLPGRAVDVAFGHSFGGNVVLGLAARRPELIRRAVVFETPLSWFDWWPSNTAGGAATRATNADEAAEAFMRKLVGDDRWERLPESTRVGRRAEGGAMMGELNDVRRAAPWAAHEVRCPVLAVGGEHGREHHQRGMQLLADMMQSAQYVRLDGAGHNAPNTHPVELAALVRGWLIRDGD